MFIVMVVVFVLGYLAIALEHPLRVDKAVPALVIGSLLWVLYMCGAYEIFTAGWRAMARYPRTKTTTITINMIRKFG